jgi:uncharacterized protein
MNNAPEIIKAILDGYELEIKGPHGPFHWARVYQNGMKLAEKTGADVEVVTLFSLFHDARRVNDSQDWGHGHRGAELAGSLRVSLVHLDDKRFELLYDACALHTDGLTVGDITVLTCWDADRLDLGRVGTTPVGKRLCTDAARELIPWAHENASSWYEPEEVLKAWGIV